MITEFKDIDYTVNMTIGKSNDCYVDFEVFEILGNEDGAESTFWKKGEMSNFPGTTSIEEAEYFVKGFIKWDACANIEFNNMIHFCGPTHVKNFGTLMTRLFDLAYEMMPTADEGMFERQIKG